MKFTVRAAKASDLDELLRVDQAVVADGRGVVLAPEEHLDRQGMIERIATFTSGERSGSQGTLLVAERAGTLLGEATIHKFGLKQLSHIGLIGIHVDPAAQRQGVGRALMHAIEAWAVANGVHRIELYTRADNQRAVRLYESLGYQLEGTRRDFLRLPDGTFVDDHVMAKLLERS